MRPLFHGTFSFLCGGMIFLTTGCERIVEEVVTRNDATKTAESPLPRKASRSPQVSQSVHSSGFPFNRKLTDSNGRALDAQIVGKQAGKIAFLRLPDKKHFVLPLHQLSRADRTFFASVPDGKSFLPAGSRSAPAANRRARWTRDLGNAKKEARRENLPIYVLFTGSTWCPPCKKLERTVLSSQEFRSFADKNLVLLKFDVPQSGDAYAEERKQFSVRSFPSVFVIDADGKRLGARRGYGSEAAVSYIEKLTTFIR